MSIAATLVAALRDGRWLTRPRVRAYTRIVLAIELLGLVIMAGRTYGVFLPIDPPTSLDYMSFQAAGRLADEGTPAAAYDEHRLGRAEKRIYGDPRIPLFGFYYPPMFQLLCAGLALLPFTLSYLLFMAATALAYLAVLRGTLRDGLLIAALISFPAAFFTVIVGQNAFLTAALFGGALLLLDRRPVIAGILFGALCYKPHFLLLVPVALIAGRYWTTLIAAALSALAVAALSLAVLGWDTWHAFLSNASLAQSVFETGRVAFWYLVSPYGAVRLVGGSHALGLAVQAMAALGAAVAVALVWHRRLDRAVRSAVLIAATLVAVPVILFYDLLPATVAMAWLIVDARRRVYPPWEKILFCAMWPIALLCRGIGEKTGVPTGWLVTVALLALALLHARRAAAPASSLAIEIGEKG